MIEPFTRRPFIRLKNLYTSDSSRVPVGTMLIIVSGGATSQVRHHLIGRRQKTKNENKKEDGTNIRRRGTSVDGFYMMVVRKLASTSQFFTLSYRTCDTARSRWVQSLCITKGSRGGVRRSGQEVRWNRPISPTHIHTAGGAVLIGPPTVRYTRNRRGQHLK